MSHFKDEFSRAINCVGADNRPITMKQKYIQKMQKKYPPDITHVHASPS